MRYFEFFNPHPQAKLVTDCVKRAFVKATGIDYMEVQRELNRVKRELGYSCFNEDKVWRTFIERQGFQKESFPARKGEKRMTVATLAETCSPHIVYVCQCANHLVCIRNNKYYDTWDSGNKCVYTAYWKYVA